MQLYADPITVNCKKVFAGFKLMGVPFTHEHVDYFKGEQKGDSFVALNPMAALPALKDGDLVLPESNAILQYAADKYGKSEFYPTDLQRRAEINRWLFWESNAWFPSCYVYLVQNCVMPLLGGQTDNAALEREAPNFHKLAGILDHALAGGGWLVGAGPTIADIAVASAMHLHAWQKLPLGPHPHLARWMTEKVERLPAWQETMVYEGFVTQKKAA
jgi:glutathione S-transferase